MDKTIIQEIKNLKSKINDPEDSHLYKEAIKCLNAKAYRASYIMLWLSCVESLKRKFKDAASTGDSKANNYYSKLCKKEKEHDAIDKFLLDNAKNYGFLDDFEHAELNNIMATRSVCAHPYGRSPDIESLYFAATRVVKYVLSRPTELGEMYINNLLLDLKKPQFLPRDAKKYLLSKLSRIALKHLSYAYVKTIEVLKSIPKDNSLIINRYKIVLSVLAEKIPTGIKSSEFFHNLICSDPEYVIYSISPQTIGSFGKDNRECIIKYLYSERDYKYIQVLYEKDVLDDAEKAIFKETLNSISVEDMYRCSIKLEFIVENLRKKLSSSFFDKLNGATDYITSHLDQLSELDEDTQREFGRRIFQISSETGADYDGSAQHATNFIKNIPQNTPPYMAFGMFEKMFDVKEKILFVKRTYMDFDSLAKILSSKFTKEELQKHFYGLESIQLTNTKFISKVQASKLTWISSILNELNKNMRCSKSD